MSWIRLASQALSNIGDAIDRGLLSVKEASRFWVRCTNNLVPHFPAVVLPQGITLGKMRQDKPTLSLAILAAGPG